MPIKQLFKLLSISCLTALLILGIITTNSQALEIFPKDYTFTGFAKPGSTASVSVTDSNGVKVDYEGLVSPEGKYSIPVKFVTKTGEYNTLYATDLVIDGKDVLSGEIMYYDFSSASDTNFTILPPLFEGSGATPNGDISLTLPDGSKVLSKADSKGDFSVLFPTPQQKGQVSISNLDGLGLEVGTPIKKDYAGGITVLETTQVAAKTIANPIYVPKINTPPEPPKSEPAKPETPVTPTVTPKKTENATVRTGGNVDNVQILSIILGITGLLFIFRKKFNQISN